MVDNGPQNKDRWFAVKREIHNLEISLMDQEKNIKSHAFEIEFATDKLTETKKQLDEKKSQLKLYE